MIRNEREYQEAVNRIRAEKERLAKQEAVLRTEMKLRPEEVKRVLDPLWSFHLQLEEEARSYERLRRGEFDELKNLHGVGQLLISLRIARGMTQKQLADILDVHESQVSRDERNEYHGITLDRAARILDALGVLMRCKVELPATLQYTSNHKEPVSA